MAAWIGVDHSDDFKWVIVTTEQDHVFAFGGRVCIRE